MKALASILVFVVLALGLASCAETETREQKFSKALLLAEKGDMEAQYNLGLMYEQGYGVTPDKRKAAAWFEKAARKGEAGAQYRLGFLYSQGRGVPKDLQQAAGWYQKAAEQGYAPARAALNNMHPEVEEAPRDSSQGAYRHKKSPKANKYAEFVQP